MPGIHPQLGQLSREAVAGAAERRKHAPVGVTACRAGAARDFWRRLAPQQLRQLLEAQHGLRRAFEHAEAMLRLPTLHLL